MNLEQLRKTLSGSVITQGDPEYESIRERLIWNARKPICRPDVIIQAASAEDVQAAVRFTQSQKTTLSVRGGGHHWSGIALQQGVVLDLAALNQLNVDRKTHTAEAGPAVTNREVAGKLAEQELAFPVGHCPTVPLSGYLLGGGFGWNSTAWGMACFSVESLDVVTADAELKRVSANEYPEIFWAARGAGPNFFGVVTAYRLRLQPLPRSITTSVRTYALDGIDHITQWISSIRPTLPANVEITIMLSSAPPPLADRAANVATAVATVFADTQEEAEAVLERISADAPPNALSADLNLPTPFDTLFNIIDGFFPEGRRYAADTYWSAEEAPLLRRLADQLKSAPSPYSLAIGQILPPPQPEKFPTPDAAFSMTDQTFAACYSIWQDPADDAANLNWLRETGRVLTPMATGHYVGEADLETAPRMRASFSPEAWKKLDTLRQKYDPEGLFQKAPAQQTD